MKKNYFQDIKPPQARIQEVKEETPRKANIDAFFKDRALHTQHYSSSMNQSEKPKRSLWIIAGFSVAGLIIALLYAFGGATVTVTPAIETISLDQEFVAQKDGTANATLPYQLMILKEEVSDKISGGELKDVAQKAQGKVVLYNEYSSSPQPLKEDTRLEAPDGKIYKIKGAVQIPGTTTNNGVILAGQLEVVVVAENPGPDYNITSPVEFKIFGFKGTPKYQKFYGKNNTSIEGGFIGKKALPDEASLSGATQSLETALKDKLLSSARAQIPSGFVLLNGAELFMLEPIASGVPDATGTLPISMKGTLYGFLFNKDTLESTIVKKIIPDYDESPIDIRGLDTLLISIKDKEKIAPSEAKEIHFSLRGDATVVWQIDVDKIQSTLAGKERKKFMEIMKSFPTITKAELSLRPVWVQKITMDKTSIKVIAEEK